MSFLVSFDDLEAQIDESLKLGNNPKIFETTVEDARHLIFPLLYELHPVEASIVYLYIFKGKSQDDIATLFGITQGAVSGRLKRASERLKFLYSLPRINRRLIHVLLSSIIFNEMWVDVVTLMIETTSFAATARILGISQGGARQAFASARKIIQRTIRESTPETVFPPQRIVNIFVMQENDGMDASAEEVGAWMLGKMAQVEETLDAIVMNFSILAKDKCGIPGPDLIDLTSVKQKMRRKRRR